ncbi:MULTISPECIES: hypothetical protein [Rubritalea]|nr:hypothetical protein [Rubritalea squalenifaciens]
MIKRIKQSVVLQIGIIALLTCSLAIWHMNSRNSKRDFMEKYRNLETEPSVSPFQQTKEATPPEEPRDLTTLHKSGKKQNARVLRW